MKYELYLTESKLGLASPKTIYLGTYGESIFKQVMHDINANLRKCDGVTTSKVYAQMIEETSDW